jgi:hypothetical protein
MRRQGAGHTCALTTTAACLTLAACATETLAGFSTDTLPRALRISRI